MKEEAAQEAQRAMLEENVISGELMVPAHAYFAMGDKRDNSV